MEYKTITPNTVNQLPIPQSKSSELLSEIKLLSRFFPFKSNNYVINELIDWTRAPDDPLYLMNIPHRNLVDRNLYHELVLQTNTKNIDTIRLTDPAFLDIRRRIAKLSLDQCMENRMIKNRTSLSGVYHLFPHTALLFPREAHDCHAYCTYCGRWRYRNTPSDFAVNNYKKVIEYLQAQSAVTDIQFTGGDPFTMNIETLGYYVEPLLKINHIQNIRFATKSLTWWPYRFISDTDSDDLLHLLESIHSFGKHATIMAHFSHPRELTTIAVQKAIDRIHQTNTIIRSQSPIVGHINDASHIWQEMLRIQISLGIIPYYAFLESSHALSDFYKITIAKALQLMQDVYKNLSGLVKTVSGPVITNTSKKILVDGKTSIAGKDYFIFKILQSSDNDENGMILLAEFDENAVNLEQLRISLPIT